MKSAGRIQNPKNSYVYFYECFNCNNEFPSFSDWPKRCPECNITLEIIIGDYIGLKSTKTKPLDVAQTPESMVRELDGIPFLRTMWIKISNGLRHGSQKK